jgi:hypothetical protein
MIAGHRRVSLLCFGLLLAHSSPVVHAKALQPPSQWLDAATNNTIVAEVIGIDLGGKLSLKKLADIHGQKAAPSELTLTTPPWLLTKLSPGQRYVIAYTAYTRSAVKPKTLVAIPTGPTLLIGPGLEPALFLDSPSARKLLTPTPRKIADVSRPDLDFVLAGLASGDGQYQNYFAAELALRPELQVLLTATDEAQISAFVRNPQAHPSARALLLISTTQRTASAPPPWIDAAASDILAGLSETGHQRADDFSAALANAAFSVLQGHKTFIALPTLARWIGSDSPPLAEQALLMIRQQAPTQERSLAEAALSLSLLQAETRTFLHDHLRRLTLMEQALRATAPDG